MIVRQAGCHRTRRQEDAGDVTKCGGSNDETGHDFIANAQIQSRVIDVVGQGHARSQCDHVAGKQRQFHADLTLCHAITHCRHATGHLRGCAFQTRGFADLGGVGFKRLMRGQHIVVGGDDPDVRGLGVGKGGFVIAHSGVSVGLVATGQMRAARAFFGGAAHTIKICGAHFLGPFFDPFGNFGDCGVNSHSWRPIRLRRLGASYFG